MPKFVTRVEVNGGLWVNQMDLDDFLTGKIREIYKVFRTSDSHTPMGRPVTAVYELGPIVSVSVRQIIATGNSSVRWVNGRGPKSNVSDFIPSL